VRTVHAEANVILQSDFSERQGATIYTTDMPCWDCCKLIVNSGISRIVYEREYPRHKPHAKSLCQEKGVLFEEITVPGPPLEEVDDFKEVDSVLFEES
jgi:dCMP deaminase